MSGHKRAWLTSYGRLVSRAAWRALERFYSGDNLVHAASIAYWTLLSLVPFTMLVLAFVGQVSSDPEARRGMLNFVLTYFPGRVEVIRDELDSLSRSPVRLGVAGFVFMTWSALGVFGAVSTAVNYAWGVERPRSFVRHRLFSLAMLGVVGLVLYAALMMATASKVVQASWFDGVLRAFPGIGVLGSFAMENLSRVILVVVVGMIFYVVPNVRVRFRDVWLGALVTGILLSMTLEALAWFYSDVNQFPRLSGSLAAVTAFLFWVYVQAAILLYGVQFTAAFARLLGDVRSSPPESARARSRR